MRVAARARGPYSRRPQDWAATIDAADLLAVKLAYGLQDSEVIVPATGPLAGATLSGPTVTAPKACSPVPRVRTCSSASPGTATTRRKLRQPRTCSAVCGSEARRCPRCSSHVRVPPH